MKANFKSWFLALGSKIYRIKQTFTQILWFPWTLWCGLVFAAILIIAFPVLLIIVSSKNEKWIKWLHKLPLLASKIVLFLWGIRVDVRNKELIEVEGQYIYISNHTSYIDGIVAGAVIPNFLKFLGKGEILNWPVLGYLMKHLYVAVWRDDKNERAWSMVEMNEKLKTGASFFICPEGTCNTSAQLLTHFHSGAYRLAIENQIPLVALTFIGPRYIFPRKGLMIRPGKVVVYWHQPISTKGFTITEVDAIKNESMALMRADLLKHYPAGQYS